MPTEAAAHRTTGGENGDRSADASSAVRSAARVITESAFGRRIRILLCGGLRQLGLLYVATMPLACVSGLDDLYPAPCAAGANCSGPDGGVDDRPHTDDNRATDTGTPEPASAPQLLASVPPHNAVDVDVSASLLLEFDQAVRPGPGHITLRSAAQATVETLPATDARVSFVNNAVVVTWSQPLSYDSDYEVHVDEDAVLANSDEGAAWTPTMALTFRTIAPPAPVLIHVQPAVGATDVAPNANLVLTFSEPIALGPGSLELWGSGNLVERFKLGSPTATLSDATLTLNPTEPLMSATTYALKVGRDAIICEHGVAFGDSEEVEVLSFTTASEAPSPLVLSATVPTAGSRDVDLTSELSLTFETEIRAGTGTWALYNATSEELIESATIADARVSISANTARFTLTTSLAPSSEYYVTVDAGSFESLEGAAFLGLSGNSLWTFSTRDKLAGEGECPADSIASASGRCYFISASQSTWDGARSLCQERGQGWDLATPRSAQQQQELEKLIDTETWLGASDLDAAGSWKWATDSAEFWRGDASGSAIDDQYTRWGPMQPQTDSGSGHCVRLVYVGEYGSWLWATSNCGFRYSVICEGSTQ